MKKPRQRSPRFEQLELFVERTNRPRWVNLSREARERISELIAQMFLVHLHGNDLQHNRKEVVHDR